MKFSKYNIIHTTENQEHILFNSLWGSTFVISPSVKQAIESSNPTLLTEEENRLFIKYNALIPDEYNESCIYNHFYNKSRYGKKCLTATVLLTWSCNFRCIWRELIPKRQCIVGDFQGVRTVCFQFSDGIVTEIVNQHGIYNRNVKACFLQR